MRPGYEGVRTGYERIRDFDSVAYTVTIRTDLLVDVDADGRILGIERIGDDVRARDLIDVLLAARLAREVPDGD
jgi:uncharacterized protein YuzE